MQFYKLTLLYLCLLVPLTTFAKVEDKLSGRLEVTTPKGETLVFPALKTDYKVDIQGDLVTVQVVQTFENPLSFPLNVTYLFPLHKDAAVYAMQMAVGDEIIRAQIDKVKAAEKTFAKAKQAGKSAALLKQYRPNMFTQDIANLMPGMPITITLSYVHTVPKVDGDYELVLPLVVGPRFQPPHAGKPATTTHESQDGLQTEQVGNWELEVLPEYPPVPKLDNPQYIETERVSLHIQLNAGMSIQHLASPTHALHIETPDEQQRVVQFAAGRVIDNRDFVLRYRLDGERSQAGLLSHHDGENGFFSLMLEPPAVPQTEHITPREMVFVLDCSGSMNGLPLNASKAFMREALRNLRPTDNFRIVTFSNEANEFSRTPLPATEENIQAGIRYTNDLHGGGGTMIVAGLHQAFGTAVPSGSIRLVTFLTDGYVGNEREILLLLQQLQGSARMFALGVGAGVNRYLLNEMGRLGNGFTRYMDSTEEVETVAKELAQRLQSPVLTDIEIDWGKLNVAETLPQRIPDLFAGQSLRIQGQYKQGGHYQIKVHGLVNGRKATLPLDITLPEQVETDGKAISLMWARSAIQERMRLLNTPSNMRDKNLTDTVLKQQITQLGLTHSLVTRWTAFIAVSEKVYNRDSAQAQQSSVPLPQVKGIGASAYGKKNNNKQFSGKAAPEPAFILGVLLIIGLLLGFVWWRNSIQTTV